MFAPSDLAARWGVRGRERVRRGVAGRRGASRRDAGAGARVPRLPMPPARPPAGAAIGLGAAAVLLPAVACGTR